MYDRAGRATRDTGIKMQPTKDILRNTFGDPVAFYVGIFEEIQPILALHEYQFINDEVWNELVNSGKLDPSTYNHVLSLELIDKAHLAAVTALFRNVQWLKSIAVNYQQENFVGWAAATRGLLESVGDIVDGLSIVPSALAAYHLAISAGLAGRQNKGVYGFSELEHLLDHFVLAKWMRAPKGDVRKAKENHEYVQTIPLPCVMDLYRRLCGITHPSSASIEYLFEPSSDGFKVDFGKDAKSIDRLISEFPEVSSSILAYGCNPPLLILRVLHKFGRHPKLSALRQIDFSPIPAWSQIKRDLDRR
jgi:hypothetical protein